MRYTKMTYTNPHVATAIAKCRKDGGEMFQIAWTYDRTGEAHISEPLPEVDAERLKGELERNPGFSNVRYHPERRCCAYGGPTHNGSKHCESGSIASGGKNAHCSCDVCF